MTTIVGLLSIVLSSLLFIFAVADEISIVVDNECVYTINGAIKGASFNATSQICCIHSGVHDKYNEQMEVKCCGDTTYRPEIQICCQEQVYLRKEEKKCCVCRKNKSRDNVDGACKDQVYSSLTHKCCGHMVRKIEERCRRSSKDFPKVIRHFRRLWFKKTKNTYPFFMYIRIDKANIFPKIAKQF